MTRGDAFLKLARADEHLDTLYAEIEAWSASHPYRIIRESKPDSDLLVVYAEPLSQPPLKLSLILGDVLQNLRACLDYIALDLNERGLGAPLAEGAEHASHFPICRSEKLFAEACRSIIPHVAPGPRTVIKRVQPYHRGEDWTSDYLAIVQRLSDFDKHRRLPLVAQHAHLSPTDGMSPARWQATEFEVTFPRVFEAKTELFRAHGLTDVTGSEVDVDFRLTVDVAFADGAPAPVANAKLTAVMETLWQHIGREIVLPLKPYLQ